jgi:hypothetical protein
MRELLPILSKTGQTISYRTGDDGNVQAGTSLPRFEVIGGSGNLVVDWCTMLMWVREVPRIRPDGSGLETLIPRGTWSASNNYAVNNLVQGDGNPNSLFYIALAASGPSAGGAQEPPNTAYWVETKWTASASNLTTPSTIDWNTAVDLCLMTYAGFGPWSATNPTGWRLPNIVELGTIMNFGDTYGKFADFPNTPTGSFWSSTTRLAGTGDAHNYTYNSVRNQTASGKTNLFYARPVRSLMA